MPIAPAQFALLRAGNLAAVTQAHGQLLQDGYAFVGYHGTNHEAQQSLVPYGFDPTRVGSGAGIARGPGFYVAMGPDLARDYADESTQAGDPQPPAYDTPRKLLAAGVQAVLRIYARHFAAMRVGTHFAWGVQSRAGDPNGDLNVGAPAKAHDLEIVFAVAAYPRLAALPSLGNADAQLTRSRAFEMGDRPDLPPAIRRTRSATA